MNLFRRQQFNQRVSTQSTTCGVSGCEQPRWGGSSMCDGHAADARERLNEAERKQGEH